MTQSWNEHAKRECAAETFDRPAQDLARGCGLELGRPRRELLEIDRGLDPCSHGPHSCSTAVLEARRPSDLRGSHRGRGDRHDLSGQPATTIYD